MPTINPFGDASTTLRNAFLGLFKEVHHRKKGVVVASSQRCGTHLIGAYLKAVGIGVPGEHFLTYLNGRHDNSGIPATLARTLDGIVPDGSGGDPEAFSLVLMGYAGKIANDLEAVGLSRALLARALEHLTWVWLRRDWVEVAVSHYFSVKTGIWESHAGAHAVPHFDPAQIHRWWRHIQDTEVYWARFFERSSIRPIELDYAELIQGPSALVDVAARAGGDPARLAAAVPPGRMPHAQAKLEYAARFRDFLAEERSKALCNARTGREEAA